MGAATTSIFDPGTIAVIVGTAIALAVAAGAWSRRRIDKTRSTWREQDQVNGWKDGRGNWHPGVIDEVFGWDDVNGIHHEGLIHLRAKFKALEELGDEDHGGSKNDRH